MILISIASHLYEFEENIKALWHKVQIKTDLCEDKQMKIHRLIISSYSPIDDLSLKVVTKTSFTTKYSGCMHNTLPLGNHKKRSLSEFACYPTVFIP